MPDVTVDEGQIRTFFEIIHNHAKLAFEGVERPGWLVLDRIHPSGEKILFEKFAIGDVENMVAAAVRHARGGFNVYLEGRAVREGAKKRGLLAETSGVFGLVTDGDADKGRPADVNGLAGLIIESSPPANRHEWILIAPAMPAERAQSVGDSLRARAGGDDDTGNVTQCYRVPGTPNYPNRKKRERGRVEVLPTRILEHTGRVLTPEELAAAFPPGAKTNGAGAHSNFESASGAGVDWTEAETRLPTKLRDLIRSGAANGRRSDQFHGVVGKLKKRGWTVDAIAKLFSRFPDGIAQKYRTRIPEEVERSFEKIEGPSPVPGTSAPGAGPAQLSALPTIRIVKGELPRMVTQAEQSLLDAGFPLFNRGGMLMRPVEQEMEAADGRTTRVTALDPLCVDLAVDYFSQAALWEKYDARAEGWLPADPPHQVARTLLARKGHWKIPAISGLISAPTLRPDGSLITAPGYDAATRLFLVSDSTLHLPGIPDAPTRADALKALETLRELLDEFPFVTPTDRAVALSGVITVLVRAAIPVAPLHAVKASTPGSGKSFLIDLIATILTGRACPVISAVQDEAETEKRLCGMLLAGVPIISIDNAVHDLGGALLCQATERPSVSLRPLGRSDMIEVVSKATLFANGNNLVLRGDMSRRTIRCDLDANEERPDLREFKRDPIAMAIKYRGHCIAAALIISRAYQVAGAPRVVGPIGSYGGWSKMVRSPLVWLGESDPVESMEVIRAEDPELASIRELFTHWLVHFHPYEGYVAHRIADTACEKYGFESKDGKIDFNPHPKFKYPEFRELLLRVAGDGGMVSTRKLSRWLGAIAGRIVDGYRLRAKPSEGHGAQFALDPVK